MDRSGNESLQVATTEGKHYHDIIFINENEPAGPGGWTVEAGSGPPAAVSESGDNVFIFAGLAAVQSNNMPHLLCACSYVCM